MEEARRNDEMISLADSQVLRWIDELNGITDADEKAKAIKQQIRQIRKEENSIQNRRQIRQLYSQLDNIQFKPDYMCLIIDKEKDYYRACKGFSINGISYRRLLGTNGGIKNSTIVFVSERLHAELSRRIENGRDVQKPLVPAKLEAYKALTCSASTPVSMPNGVIVVDDCETSFLSDIIYLTDEAEGEPVMEYREQERVSLDESDGYGIMLPALAERWSREAGLDYLVAGVNTRFSFEKGMVFTFDFLEFAKDVAGSFTVTDAWGVKRDVRDAELILTTSMVKLWDSYKGCEEYIQSSLDNGYTFGIAKTCPKELESQRTLNYQFIQSYDLSDEDIDLLAEPTIKEISGVLGGDWRHTVLFMKGSNLNAHNLQNVEDGYIKAVMADQRMIHDPFVRNCVYQAIRNRINEAKVGVLKVHGNYSIVSGDPYALCQHMFSLPVTGLLGKGEIYNNYWVDCGVDRLACFRAPMTCHNNIRLVRPSKSETAAHWYRYMNTCTVFNAWDTAAHALNGMDKDGDLVMLTDNMVLVDKLKELPALMCAQRRATKKVVTEDDLIRSNVESFGNDIGRTTNWITSMFEVQSKYKPSDPEYQMLEYRIRCGQLYQQNAIDKAKGIVAKPMPREWYDRHAVNKIDDPHMRKFYRDIVADKKPYFMRYIYPTLMKQYNTYIRNTNRSALREFQMTMEELRCLPEEKRTDRQEDFLRYYNVRMPVGLGDCVMNKICRKFENAFDGFAGRISTEKGFDYTIMKSGVPYSYSQMSAIRKLQDEYNKRLQSYSMFVKTERVDKDESMIALLDMREEFIQECAKVCPDDRVLCDIVLDLCYQRSTSKKFAWDICSTQIIRNLLDRNGGTLSAPMESENGDLEFCGKKYAVIKVKLEESHEHCAE